MPATNAEKRRTFIAKLKANGEYDAFKKKKAELEKARRKRLKESLKKLSDSKRKKVMHQSRLKCCERVKKCRERKVGLTDNTLSQCLSSESVKFDLPKTNFGHSYRTDAALAKATNKAAKGFPSCPIKKIDVLAKMVYALDDKAQERIFRNKTTLNKGGRKGIAITLIEEVREFYERDDVSRVSPNVKDVRKLINPTTGEKEWKPIRHLTVTLEQAYQLFTKENTGKSTVKLAKFCSLRPTHVKLMGSMPQNSCVCKYHSNFIECSTVLHNNLSQFPSYGPELTKFFVCDELNEECWLKRCANCLPNKIESKLLEMVEESKEKMVKYKLWKTDKVAKRTQQNVENTSLLVLMNHFISIYRAFLKHSFTLHTQFDDYTVDRKYVNSADKVEECVLQVDFTENYTCVSQDEAVEAHWNQKQISLFTVALRYLAKVHSQVIVSDNNDHSKNTLVAYIYTILTKIPKAIKVVRLWSDGPNSQFKNRYTAAIIKLFEDTFSIKLIWNFFPTAHGKGCVDGIGAVAKNRVKRLVKARKQIVNCAKDFVNAYNSEKSSMHVFELSSTDINKINSDMGLEQLFNNAPAVKNIFSCHQLQYTDNRVAGFLTSKAGYNRNSKL